ALRRTHRAVRLWAAAPARTRRPPGHQPQPPRRLSRRDRAARAHPARTRLAGPPPPERGLDRVGADPAPTPPRRRGPLPGGVPSGAFRTRTADPPHAAPPRPHRRRQDPLRPARGLIGPNR